jgi:hypothetical protein
LDREETLLRNIYRRLVGQRGRRLAAPLVVAIVAVLGATVPAHASSTAAPSLHRVTASEFKALSPEQLSTTWWYIQNVNSGLYLTAAAPASTNGSPVVQRSRLAGSQSQAWTFTAGSVAGYDFIRSAATSSWKALGISGSSTANGGKAIQWTYVPGLADQQWYMYYPSPLDSYVELINLNSDKCLGIPGSSTTAGVQAVQWDCRGIGDQYWQLYFWY